MAKNCFHVELSSPGKHFQFKLPKISKHVLLITSTRPKYLRDNLRDSSASHHCLLYPLQCLCGTVSAKRASLNLGSKSGAVSLSSRHWRTDALHKTGSLWQSFFVKFLNK